MKLPLQVSFHGIDRSEALENLIAKEVEGLHKFDADLISCRVAVESEGRHQNQGRECSVRVSLNAPGHEFIMNTKNEDAHAAVRAAFTLWPVRSKTMLQSAEAINPLFCLMQSQTLR